LPIATLGPTEEATALGEALRAFIDGAPNLKLTLTATDPAGIGLAEFEAAQQNPALLAGKLRIVAEAGDEPPGAAPPAPPRDKLSPRAATSPADKAKRR